VQWCDHQPGGVDGLPCPACSRERRHDEVTAVGPVEEAYPAELVDLPLPPGVDDELRAYLEIEVTPLGTTAAPAVGISRNRAES
jgi:hypothetical protein